MRLGEVRVARRKKEVELLLAKSLAIVSTFGKP